MACLEEDPICFGFIFFGAIFLLVGGGLCGSGMEANNTDKEVSGIVLLSLAFLLIVSGILCYVVRTVRKRRKGRRDGIKRRSRKKLAQLPLVVPVDKPVPHWIVKSPGDGTVGLNGGATINPGLIDDFTDDEEYPMTSNHFRRQHPANNSIWTPQQPPPQSSQRPPLMPNSNSAAPNDFNNRGASLPPYHLRHTKSSPMMSQLASNMPPGGPGPTPDNHNHRCYARRNSIPFDLYDSTGHLRQDVPCHHRPGCADSGGGICEGGRCVEGGGAGGGSFFALVSMPNLRDAENVAVCRHHRNHPENVHQDVCAYRNWRHHRAYAVSPPVFV